MNEYLITATIYPSAKNTRVHVRATDRNDAMDRLREEARIAGQTLVISSCVWARELVR